MNPQLLAYYEKELQFIREMGGEFAERFPKIAKRLNLGDFECADPYVERLLEGFAFLSARIQLKLNAEFPRFTHHLLDIVYPHYLAPTPSMTVVHFDADLKNIDEDGYEIPRHTPLRSHATLHSRSKCQFRTAHDITLWPIEVSNARYMESGEAAFYAGARDDVRAGLRVQLQSTKENLNFAKLPTENLTFYLQGNGENPARLYELLMANTCHILAQPVTEKEKVPWQISLPASSIQSVGFDDTEALLPYTDASFQGYRLLQEYFSFSARFLFINLMHLQQVFKRCDKESAIEFIILFNNKSEHLQDNIDKKSFVLYSTPAINLFPKDTDRIHLDQSSVEHHLVVDRTRPRDFEVYSLDEITGFDTNLQKAQTFKPFYSANYANITTKQQGYYTQKRKQRLPPDDPSVNADYLGSEVFLALVDGQEAPYAEDLKQLGVKALCTNRDLPLLIIRNAKGQVAFSTERGEAVNEVYSIVSPTKPKNIERDGEYAWRFINHLSLNYLSLLNQEQNPSQNQTDDAIHYTTQGANALRELLMLYSDRHTQQQIDGIVGVESETIIRRLPGEGAIAFGRGTGIHLTCRESAFKGVGVFLLGAVLDRFFARYVSINSFTQTTLSTVERGHIMTWPVRTGIRPTL